MTAISTLLSGVSIGEPRRHGRLEIFPLFALSGEQANGADVAFDDFVITQLP